MLIEFSVSNFRSFRERQTLSMVAAPRLRRKENTFKPELDGEDFPALLKAAAIYGPNASGKSNLVRAIQSVATIIGLAPQPVRHALPVEPFRFDTSLADSASHFEIHFACRGLRYQMKLAIKKDRIEEEVLKCFPKGAETLLYERRHAAGRDNYEFGRALEGGKDLHDAWSKLTAPDRIFLSQAVANSSEELQQLRAPFAWLTGGLLAISQPPHATGVLRALANLAQRPGQKGSDFTQELTAFIHDLDIPVTRLKFDSLPLEQVAGSVVASDLRTQMPTVEGEVRAIFTHKTALGNASFDFDEESTGTQNLIGFYIPWVLLQLAEYGGGCAMIVDEIDTSLHPTIVAELIRRHLLRGGPSQLIFTTHDTHLMDAKILRRDQFWLTERDMNGATQLRSIHDFEGREAEDVEKRYYEGRYRGLPIVSAE